MSEYDYCPDCQPVHPTLGPGRVRLIDVLFTDFKQCPNCGEEFQEDDL